MLLLVSGSPRQNSANSRLLRAIGQLSDHQLKEAHYLAQLPLFQPEQDQAPWPDTVLQWRKDLAEADGVIFSTPAYLENIPAVLKNALEWVASSGEFTSKPTLVFTFTPHSPRGDRARKSLLWSLEALQARIVAASPLFQNEVSINESDTLPPGEIADLLKEALTLLPTGE